MAQGISSDIRSTDMQVSMATEAKATAAVAKGMYSMLRVNMLLAAMIVPTSMLLLTLYGWSSILLFLTQMEERTTRLAFEIIKTCQALGQVAAAVKAAEQTARAFAKTIGIVADKVKDLPIFFVFRRLTQYIYEHDLKAITGNPFWVALEYYGPDKAHHEANRKAATVGKGYLLSKDLNSLDEYPFASTFQGGAGASVAEVPLKEQTIQGNHLSYFYGAKLNYRLGWFLVVPLPI
jgi:hypothetical protein